MVIRLHSLFLLLAFFPHSYAGTNEVGTKFLEENGKKEGVITLKSGFQYKVLRKGSGKYSPKVDGTCECHYAGTTPSLTENAVDLPEEQWKEFDSSYKRGSPTSFAPNQVIKGWTEAMQLMVEGDKWEMYIPSELGYGDGGSGDKIKGGDVLIFRMEILKILGAKKRVKKCLFASITQESVADDVTGCDDLEISAWREWTQKGLKAVQTKVDELTAALRGTLKSGQREPIAAQQQLLKSVIKAMKKGKKQEDL